MRWKECQLCGNDSHLCSPREAQAVYSVREWRGQTGLMQFNATAVVCAWCHSVEIDGEWERMQSVRSRADELSRQTNKSREELRDNLRGGPKAKKT